MSSLPSRDGECQELRGHSLDGQGCFYDAAHTFHPTPQHSRAVWEYYLCGQRQLGLAVRFCELIHSLESRAS